MPVYRKSMADFGQTLILLAKMFQEDRMRKEFAANAFRNEQTPGRTVQIPLGGAFAGETASMTTAPGPTTQVPNYQAILSGLLNPDTQGMASNLMQGLALMPKIQDPGGLREFTAKEDIRRRSNVQEAREKGNIPDPRFELWKKNLESQIRARETEKPDKEANLRFSEYDDPDTGERVRISYDPKTNKEVSRERVGKSSLTSDIRNRKAALERVNPILDGISELSEKINTGQGVLAKLSGGIERVKASTNLNDDIAEYEALISGFTPMVARALGHTGVLTEQDVQSVKEMFPKAGDSKTLRDRKINRIKKLLGAMSGPLITEPTGEETKVVNGKTYVKKNGQWYESK